MKNVTNKNRQKKLTNAAFKRIILNNLGFKVRKREIKTLDNSSESMLAMGIEAIEADEILFAKEIIILAIRKDKYEVACQLTELIYKHGNNNGND